MSLKQIPNEFRSTTKNQLSNQSNNKIKHVKDDHSISNSKVIQCNYMLSNQMGIYLHDLLYLFINIVY